MRPPLSFLEMVAAPSSAIIRAGFHRTRFSTCLLHRSSCTSWLQRQPVAIGALCVIDAKDQQERKKETRLRHENVFAPAAKTHLDKLEVIQRIAARIICGTPNDAHSEPLLNTLCLPSLAERRSEHITNLIFGMLAGCSHPAFAETFVLSASGEVQGGSNARIGAGRKRFSVYGPATYNRCMLKKSDAPASLIP